jgi:2-C-methyl-D-erythritol 2,4-cyclodiphosphate synthase
MTVRFAPDVRRLIVAASTLAEARGQARPRIRDLADALATQGLDVPPFAIAALDDDLEDVLDEASGFAGDADISSDTLIRALAGLGSGTRQISQRSADVTMVDAAAPVFIASRVGIGYDSHRFAPGGPMTLGGVQIDGDIHCDGHSDGDAICHALTDALLGAANAGDIGEWFPDTDPANKGRNSIDMLKAAVASVAGRGFAVVNADVTVIAERPKIGPHRSAMQLALAAALGVGSANVSVKGKTNEGMGWIGRSEGLAVIAVASIVPRPARENAVAQG